MKRKSSARRLESLKTCLMIASIVETYPDMWWRIDEVHQAYNDNVGAKSRRSINRYLSALEEMGVIELEQRGRGLTARKVFRWIGYPSGSDLVK